jgi:hypothetical protein
MLLLAAINQLKRQCYTGALMLMCAAALIVPISNAWSQSGVAAAPLAPASAKSVNQKTLVRTVGVPKFPTKPAWQDLTPAQQLSLKPLAANWGTLDEARKRKWIAVAANYANLSPTEQAKLHSRMNEWSSLSEQQRTQARLNFARAKQLSPGKKTATWEAYQALSPDEKKKLAISAPPKPVGAAAAIKPVSLQKMTSIPVTRKTPKQAPHISAVPQVLNRNTLLPPSKPLAEPALAPTN